MSRVWVTIIGGAAMAAFGFAQGGFDGPGRYELTNLKSGKLLDLDRNDQTTVIQFSPRGAENQRWDIERAESGFYYIRNAMNGKALEITRNSNSSPLVCGRFDGNPNQQWRIQPGKDGNALIVSRAGKTIDIPDGSSRDGLRVQIYDLNGDSNQRFIVRRVARSFEGDRDRDRERRFRREPDADDRDPHPDRFGRFWDNREQMWKLAGDGACFYQQPDFRGKALCTGSGSDIADVSREFNETVSSVKLFGRAQAVVVFERPDFRGARYRINRDERDLTRLRPGWTDHLGDRMGSIRVN